MFAVVWWCDEEWCCEWVLVVVSVMWDGCWWLMLMVVISFSH